MRKSYTKRHIRRDIAEIGRILRQETITEEDANEARGMLEAVLEAKGADYSSEE